MTKTTVFGWTAIVGVLALTGCAATRDMNRFPSAEGWRSGYVKHVGSGDDLRRQVSERCMQQGAAGVDSDRFAIVHVQVLRRHHDITMPIPADAGLAPKQSVAVNVKTCEPPVALDRVP